MRFKLVNAMSVLLLTSLLASNVAALEESLEVRSKADSAAAESQKRISKLADETARDLQRFRVATQRLESLEIYNRQLSKLIDSQNDEIQSVKRQTEEIEAIETGVLPLMITMTDTLGKIVTSDLPFLSEERENRVTNLRELIDRADVTAGEKYRRIMEAYLIEVDYGRTIEAYRGELPENQGVRTVDFLRIGRIGLYYQTLDGEESGRWNPGKESFEILESGARRQIQLGIRVARKQSPPELLSLPINAPGVES